MTRVTHPDGVLGHAIYRYRDGEGIGAQAGTLHVVTPHTRFRRRNGTVQTLHQGFEAFDNWGARSLFDFRDVGIPPEEGARGSELVFERMATDAECALAQAEARFHSPEHLHTTSTLLARDFLKPKGSRVVAVGIYGSCARGDAWPHDYDLVLFVSEDDAPAFLARARRSGDGARKVSPSVLIKNGHLPEDLCDDLRLPTRAVETIEWRLHGNLFPPEIERAQEDGNPMAAWRVKKLDLQILPFRIDGAYRDLYRRTARDPDFLSRIRPDIRVFDPQTSSYSKERADALVHWEL